MPAKTTKGGGPVSSKAAAKTVKAAATTTTSDGMHPVELEGLTSDLRLKAATPEGRSRLAVLHAVRQAVVERGGAPSCTAYAGALLSSIGQRQDEETTASVVYVLGHVLQHVGPSLLRSKFVPLADVLVATGKGHPDSAPVARHTLQCIYVTIREQEGVAWRTPQMGVLSDILVSMATDPRPKVRKAAQGFLVQLMTEAGPAGEVVRTSLEGKIVNMSTSTFKACTSTNTTESQQLLGMLRDISSGLSSKALQALSQHVLKLLSNDDRTMVGQIFNTLDAFMLSDCGSDKAIARMVSTAIENQPPASAGMEPIKAYLKFLKTLLEKLYDMSADACFPKVPEALVALSDYLVPQEKTDELAIAAANVMCDIIDVCIKEPMIQQARQAAHSAAGLPSPLEAVASHAVVLLQARFKRNWHCSLAIVQSLINRLGVNCSPLMDRAVAALIDMQPRLPTIKGASPRSADELEQALGAAIVKMGPARVLELAPLIGHDGSEELQIAHPSNKLWLLPMLKKFVRAAPLAYFVRSLLPLADQIEAAAIAADARKLLVEAKNLMHVNRQIWGLLPSFCLECVDLPEALPHVARRMGTSIESEPELRNIVCSALLNAIRSMRKASDTDQSMDEDECMVTAEAAARGTAAIASFAKNFLPILFNAASTVPIAERPLLLETICEYAQITEAPRLTALFQNVMKKLLTAAAADGEMTDDTETETSKILLLDLALSLMPALDTSNAEFLYKSAIPFVADASGGVQKRAYKLLQLMSHAHTAMMQSRLAHVQEAMVEALPGLQPGASKWRLRCIAKLVEHLPFDVAYMQLLGAVMGEVILGTKSAARKTREVSFAVLVTVAQKVDAGSNGAQLGDLFTMLLAGLAGTTNTMVSATVYALSRLVYEYSDRVGQLAPPLLESVMLLFQQKSREVVTAALGFAKVAVVSLTPDVLRTYMKSLITNLLLWSGDTRNRFRLKVKVPIPLLTHLPPLPRSTRAHTSAGEDGRMTGLRSRGCVCSGSPGASDAAYILRGGARGHT